MEKEKYSQFQLKVTCKGRKRCTFEKQISRSKLGNCTSDDAVVPLNNSIFDPKMTNHSIDAYYFTGSPPARAVMMLLLALKIKHTPKEVNIMAGEQLTPEFRKMNPLHTVPVIDDDGFILYDSHAIMKYLVDQYAKDDSLYPRDPKKGAIVSQRLYYEATYLFPSLRDYMKHIFEGKGINQDYLAKVDEALNYLDGFLENQTWVAGQYLTIADYSILSTVSTCEAAQVDVTKYPNVMLWYTRVKDLFTENGYYDINQKGCNMISEAFKDKLK